MGACKVFGGNEPCSGAHLVGTVLVVGDVEQPIDGQPKQRVDVHRPQCEHGESDRFTE